MNLTQHHPQPTAIEPFGEEHQVAGSVVYLVVREFPNVGKVAQASWLHRGRRNDLNLVAPPDISQEALTQEALEVANSLITS
jgi:hypothetical protein